MKEYQIQVRLSYYVWVDVEAEHEHSAVDQAVRKAWFEMDKQRGCWGEEPKVLDIIVKPEEKTNEN